MSTRHRHGPRPDGQRWQRRILARRVGGITAETGDPNQVVVTLIGRAKLLIRDRPVVRNSVEAPHAEIGRE